MSEQDVARWGKASPTPGQLKELHAQIESGRITSARLTLFLNGEDLKRPTIVITARDLMPEEKLAKELLGHDYISIGEVERSSGGQFTDQQLDVLRNQLARLDSESIILLRDEKFVLMPLPAIPRSLIDVRDWSRESFYTKEGGWYANEPFALEEKSSFGLIALRKEPVPKSTSKTWEEQLDVLPEGEFVPNAAEFASCVATLAKVRGIRIFPGIYVRTSSVGSYGGQVDFGDYGSKGLGVGNYWDNGRYEGLGLASAKKFG